MEIIFLHYDAWEIILLRQLLLRHLVVFVLLDVPIYVEKGFGPNWFYIFCYGDNLAERKKEILKIKKKIINLRKKIFFI